MHHPMKLLLLGLMCVSGSKVGPIQKVLELLSDLQSKIIKEGEVEQENFEELSKLCAQDSIQLRNDIKNGHADVETFTANKECAEAKVSEAVASIGTLSADIATNESDLAEATKLRKQDHADHVAESSELTNTIDALSRAHRVLKKSLGGSGGSFVQSNALEVTNTLKKIVDSASIAHETRDALISLVQEGDDDGEYESKSGGILATIESMREKAEESLNASQKEEMKSKFNYDMLKQSLEDKIGVMRKQMSQAKQSKNGNQEKQSTAEGDLSNAERDLVADEKSLNDRQHGCMTAATEFEVGQKGRAEELSVIAKAKEILSPPSFIQIKAHAATSREMEASEFLMSLSRKYNSDVFAQIASRVREGPFGKVKKMIQDMITKLINEQAKEGSHKAWCDEELGKTRKAIEEKQASADRLGTKIQKDKAMVKKLTEGVARLRKSLQKMNEGENEATTLRMKQKGEFNVVSKELSEGLDAVTRAVGVLRDYYEGDSGSGSSGGGGAASSIIGMLEVAQSDLSKSLSEAKATESDSQEEFEKMVADNKVSKAVKSQDIKNKEAEINRIKKAQNENESDSTDVEGEIAPLNKYLDELKGQCQTKVPTFEEIQARRKAKIEGLKSAMEILQGQASFIQNSGFLS